MPELRPLLWSRMCAARRIEVPTEAGRRRGDERAGLIDCCQGIEASGGRIASRSACEQHGKRLPHWRAHRGVEGTSRELLACGLDATSQTHPPPSLSSLSFALYCYSSISLTPVQHHQLLRPTAWMPHTPSKQIQFRPPWSHEKGETETEKGWLVNKKNLCRLEPIVLLCLAQGEKQALCPHFSPLSLSLDPPLELSPGRDTKRQKRES